MKATKILLSIAFLAFATMSYSSNDPEPQGAVKISLKKAMEDRGLVKAIYQQIDPRTFLQNKHDGPYIANVYFRHVYYAIFAKYEEWVKFFLMDPNDEMPDVLQAK